MVKLQTGDYTLIFADGGAEIRKEGEVLYFNKRPMYAFVKTIMAVEEFFDQVYTEVKETDEGAVAACGVLETPGGSRLQFEDLYQVESCGMKISRTVTVLEKGADDIGFATKISFVLTDAETIRDYDCFAPATWYQDNKYARPHVVGFDAECEYNWRKETGMTLPLFAAQSRKSGEAGKF